MSSEDLITVSGSIYLYFSLCRGKRTGLNEVTGHRQRTLAVSIETPGFKGDHSHPWDQCIEAKLTQRIKLDHQNIEENKSLGQ